MVLAYLPLEQNEIREFSIEEGLLMVWAIAIQQNIFAPLQTLFEYFQNFWA